MSNARLALLALSVVRCLRGLTLPFRHILPRRQLPLVWHPLCRGRMATASNSYNLQSDVTNNRSMDFIGLDIFHSSDT
jgi:hypothetical protein